MNVTSVDKERIISFILRLIPESKTQGEDEVEFWNQHWKRRIEYMEQHGVPWQFDGEWQRNVYKNKIDAFEKLAGNVSGRKILEPGAGCGIVSMVQTFRGAEVYLVELSDYAIQYLHMMKAYLNAERTNIVKADLFNLPYKNDSFDIAWNSGVIEHYGLAQTAIEEMKRVTKSGGKLMVAVPNLLSPELVYNALRNGRGTEQYFSRGSLSHFLKESSLENVETIAVSSVLPSFIPDKVILRASKYEKKFAEIGLGLLYFAVGTVKK